MSLLTRLCISSSAAAVVIVTAFGANAQARPAGPDGTVIAIDGGELVVDVGSGKGVHDGDVVELWRPLRLKHPVTGQMLVDRFRIGTLRLVQVRGTLSLGRVEGQLTRPAATGDVIVFPDELRDSSHAAIAVVPVPRDGALAKSAPPAGTGTTAPASAALPPNAPPLTPRGGALPQANSPAPLDADGQALGDLMGALTGSDPGMRAQAYETFVRSHPKSRFAKVLGEEVTQLRASHQIPRRRYESSAPQLDHVRAGEPQRFAVELDAAFVGAVVHVRRKGAPGYRSVPMENIGPRYWAATLPGDAMTGRGMEYFVEGVPKESPAVAIVGTAEEPRVVDVDAQPGTPRPQGTLAQVMLQSEYASFNVKDANDYVWQTEGTVGWRLGEKGVRAVRSGFGVLRGRGGSLHELDDLKQSSSVGLTYGYVEGELALSRSYSLIARPILGLRERGITGGAQGFVRIGNDLQTNLSIGGEVLGTIGQRGIVQLDWRTIKRVPIVLRTEVTNQPSGSSDVGARAIAQVGYQLTDEFGIAARVSYQGRTINHAGPGAGLAVSYQW